MRELERCLGGVIPVVIIVMTLILVGGSGLVQATIFDVPTEGYSGTDTLDGAWYNRYDFIAEEGKRVSYDFEVIGIGTIEVYLVKTDEFSIFNPFTYYNLYSADSPVKSYSRSYTFDEEDMGSFSLVVFSSGGEDLTYTASITIEEVTTGDRIVGCALGILLIGGLFVFTFFKLKLYNKITEFTTPKKNAPPTVSEISNKCSKCGAVFKDDWIFCGKCGAKQE